MQSSDAFAAPARHNMFQFPQLPFWQILSLVLRSLRGRAVRCQRQCSSRSRMARAQRPPIWSHKPAQFRSFL